MKQVFLIGLALALAGCGQSDRGSRSHYPQASGPISRACMASDREARSERLCGCIQYAAGETLTRGQQRRAAKFYKNPHQAQVIRMSSRDADNEFWADYKAHGALAERLCR